MIKKVGLTSWINILKFEHPKSYRNVIEFGSILGVPNPKWIQGLEKSWSQIGTKPGKYAIRLFSNPQFPRSQAPPSAIRKRFAGGWSSASPKVAGKRWKTDTALIRGYKQVLRGNNPGNSLVTRPSLSVQTVTAQSWGVATQFLGDMPISLIPDRRVRNGRPVIEDMR